MDGVNLTARIGDGQALPLLAELGHAVALLDCGKKGRTTLQSYVDDEVWELGLEADGEDVLISVYRSAPSPEVAVHERRVELAALAGAVAHALDDALAGPQNVTVRAPLEAARQALSLGVRGERGRALRQHVEVHPRPVRGFGLWANVELRKDSNAALVDHQVERADLHALLARGEAGIRVRGRSGSLGAVHVVLLAERLMALADDVVDAWQCGRATFRRVELSGVRIGVQRGTGEAPMALAISLPEPGRRLTFPGIDPIAFVQMVARFARSIGESVTSLDPSQAKNLRLRSLMTSARALSDRAEDLVADDSVQNHEPESYRSFSAPPRRSESKGRWEHGGKMRFMPRWVATVPNIDLRATFLCGDRLIVGSERETACIQRTSGTLLWRKGTSRAAAVATPAGLARLHADGLVSMHELDTGEVRFSNRLEPRSGGGASGAVVHTPGLPKLLIVAEGDRRITAIDLISGDVRWRHTARRPGVYRMRRAGKLLLVGGGDSVLWALDVATGEVVWRLRGRLPFTGDVCIDHDSAFALASASSTTRLFHLDPWSGKVEWETELDERPVVGQAPLLTPDAVVVPVRDRRGGGLAAFCKDTGEPLWQHAPGLTSPTVAWLSVDGSVVGNSSAGTLLCVDSKDGGIRYSHVFPRHVDADQPRRLEPVLRSGALFVPQHQVHVVRPRDGEILGTVPTDLIPDLLRVDERCDVYVAEESGHVAAFGAAARLTLVR